MSLETVSSRRWFGKASVFRFTSSVIALKEFLAVQVESRVPYRPV